MVLIRNVVLAVGCLAAIAGTASADDAAVVSRLTSHGDLSTSAAKKLVGKVNMRMSKSADATASTTDPMRAAVSLALFQSPTPPNNMASAKVRLRLYAGLNEWALEAIFSPQPGVLAGCVREIGATQAECEALVAAAAESSVAEIRRSASGAARGAAPSGYAQRGAAAPSKFSRGSAARAAAPAATGGSRFGRYDSGYRSSGAAQKAAPPAPRQFSGAGYQRPAAPAAPAASVAYQRPAPAAPAAPAAASADVQSRKDAYKARREAYMARQKAAFDARRARHDAVIAADAPAPRNSEVAATAAAKPVAPVASASASKAKPAAESDTGAGESVETGEVASKGKAGLDSDFLDGLLDDPLGGKGKK